MSPQNPQAYKSRWLAGSKSSLGRAGSYSGSPESSGDAEVSLSTGSGPTPRQPSCHTWEWGSCHPWTLALGVGDFLLSDGQWASHLTTPSPALSSHLPPPGWVLASLVSCGSWAFPQEVSSDWSGDFCLFHFWSFSVRPFVHYFTSFLYFCFLAQQFLHKVNFSLLDSVMCFSGVCGLEPLGVLWSVSRVFCQEFKEQLLGGNEMFWLFCGIRENNQMYILVHAIGHRFVGEKSTMTCGDLSSNLDSELFAVQPLPSQSA